ncbi:MAG: SDR family NAD(P)-dependent oxidoreductase [Thalassotalea sp.]
MKTKHVLITGATSGIGTSLVELYAKRGDNVIACGRDNKKLSRLKAVAHQLCLFDITSPKSIETASSEVGKLDILILNAGDCRYIDDVIDFDGELFSNIINTNLSANGALLQYFLKKLKKGGQVVFISSSATILPFPRSQAYGASKAGMDYLANSLRVDLLKHDIGVTLVHPGFVKTPLTDKNTFNMPFLITSDQAAQRIVNGVDKKKKYLHFPKRLTLLLKALSFLPTPVWQKIITKDDAS